MSRRLFWQLLSPAAALLLGLPASLTHAQEIHLDTGEARPLRAQHVSVETDTASIHAGQPDWVELRFHIASGYHINSHDPHDELLIPTVLHLSPSNEIKVLGEQYPAGTPLHLAIGAGETLNTYQGDLRIRVQLRTPPGSSSLAGTLHYQACDAASCFPPRDLPFQVTLSAH